MNTRQFDSNPAEVDHWTPYSHWCAECWHWVVDCQHLAEPLDAEHHAVDDACIRNPGTPSIRPALLRALTQHLHQQLNKLPRLSSGDSIGQHEDPAEWFWATG